VLISLIIDAAIAKIKEFLATQFNPNFIFLAQITNFVVSLAIILKYLPEAIIPRFMETNTPMLIVSLKTYPTA
jgi:hypothetical protein